MRYAYAGSAGLYRSQRIHAVRQSGQTITRAYRYYRLNVQPSGRGMLPHCCEDQSKAFGKDLRTGMVNGNAPSDKSYLYYHTVSQLQDAVGTWQIFRVSWTKGAAQCLNG
ncbi:hypothetical protein [Actinacidiphila sp. ITFR-21]|uniref:hypothetical protein n=1 Tax=Actinacidiphila sp. ITFR-21 TaxID=3075199 RepID=UPI00288B9C87|nr:hypothetical protein [Streptomyces sp. ITFR-21]WNI15962.1 hypothetical protein RLT57_10815 [Streptomyces sp. ITFR-21]